jgi:hypothetical protein
MLFKLELLMKVLISVLGVEVKVEDTPLHERLSQTHSSTPSKTILMKQGDKIFLFISPNKNVNSKYLRRFSHGNPSLVKSDDEVSSLLDGSKPGWVTPIALLRSGVDLQNITVIVHPDSLKGTYPYHVVNEISYVLLTGVQLLKLFANTVGEENVKIIPFDQTVCKMAGCKLLPKDGSVLCEQHYYCTVLTCTEIRFGEGKCQKHTNVSSDGINVCPMCKYDEVELEDGKGLCHNHKYCDVLTCLQYALIGKDKCGGC